MRTAQRALFAFASIATAITLHGCLDGSQSPQSRPEAPRDASDGSTLRPIDLVYVCGNKFLATNKLPSQAHVTYKVAGTLETGGLTLESGPGGDPGYSETELEVRSPGTVELYVDDALVTSHRNEGLPCGAPALSASVVALGTEATAGKWSAPFSWPLIALHLHLLRTGKVLGWGKFGQPYVWDPATNGFTAVPSPGWIFCAGHTFLSDGRLLVSGGHLSDDHGLPITNLFDPVTMTWSTGPAMAKGRWYPTTTTLANGQAVTLGGRDETGTTQRIPEVWTGSSWRQLTSASRYLPYYPRMFLAPNGKVFYAGETQATAYLSTSGTGAWTTLGNRAYPGTRDYGSAVMYRPGKILYAGGGRTTATAEIIDLNDGAPTWRFTGTMAYARRHLNATILPTGQVLVTGGTSGTGFSNEAQAVHAAELWDPATGLWTTMASNTVNRVYHSTTLLLPDGRVLHTGSGDAAGAVNHYNGEIYSPPYLFQGPRPTISSAPSAFTWGQLFLVGTPDAATVSRVTLVRLGSVTHAFDANQRFNELEFTQTTEGLTVLSPPNSNMAPPGHYMLFILDANGVPSVAKIVQVGSRAAPTPPPGIALTATGRQEPTTQSMTLSWTGATGAMVDVYRDGALIKVTENDGTYIDSRTFTGAASYVYKVCQAGTTTCSNTETVEFVAPPPPPTNAAPTAAFTRSCYGFTCTFTDHSTDDVGVTARSWAFGDDVGTSTESSPTYTFATEGSYQVTLTVTDAGGLTGSLTQTVSVTPAPPNELPTANFGSSCAALTCTFTDQSTDSDGSIASWSWSFGDGATSTQPNPTRSYASAGSHDVTLTVTDNVGATAQKSASVTTTAPPPPPPIVLSLTGRQEPTAQYITLTWSGAIGTMVDVYRNGAWIKLTENDGKYTNLRNFTGPITYRYKVCQEGTAICSNEAAFTFP